VNLWFVRDLLAEYEREHGPTWEEFYARRGKSDTPGMRWAAYYESGLARVCDKAAA
jgi:hypothetical protein